MGGIIYQQEQQQQQHSARSCLRPIEQNVRGYQESELRKRAHYPRERGHQSAAILRAVCCCAAGEGGQHQCPRRESAGVDTAPQIACPAIDDDAIASVGVRHLLPTPFCDSCWNMQGAPANVYPIIEKHLSTEYALGYERFWRCPIPAPCAIGPGPSALL